MKGMARSLVVADLAGGLVLLAGLTAGWREAAAFGLVVLIILNLLVIVRGRLVRSDREAEQ
jgi:hypothetical protein